MCTNYRAPKGIDLATDWHVEIRGDWSWKLDVYPGQAAPVIRRGSAGGRECVMARFGLVPSWAKSAQLDWSTMNARSESAAEKPAFKGAYARRQYCIVPTWTFFEPFYVPGARRSERWGISRADGGALGIAGLWDSWRSFDGDELHSFAMLTINCDQHPLLKRFHKHYDEHGAPNERRTPALLEERDYDAWLSAESALAPTFFKTFDTDELLAEASPVVPAKTERPAQAELLL